MYTRQETSLPVSVPSKISQKSTFLC
uniref:Uncharacterized protein n=1 Tax=Anguilla anguilla TaxID=7936 RepID=A0A0E9VM45_ANGAN